MRAFGAKKTPLNEQLIQIMEGALKRAKRSSEACNKTFAIRVITTAKKAPIMTRITRFIIVIVTLLTPSNALDYLQRDSAIPAAVHSCTTANVSGKAS